MRPLLILCEPAHRALIQASVDRFAHPQVRGRLVSVMEVDLQPGGVPAMQRLISQWLDQVRPGATERALVAAPREVANPLRLGPLGMAYNFEAKVTSASDLTRQKGRTGNTTPVESLLNQCGLSVLGAATAMAMPWNHAEINRATVDAWIEQFERLDRSGWIGRAVLGLVTLLKQSDLGDLLLGLQVDAGAAVCVNREPRGGWKSADVIGNILQKRNATGTVHASPAAAIDVAGADRVILFEDGLWSGTEAIGIVDSLLGKRDDRLKTPRLSKPERLKDVDLTMAYAVGTNYGVALLTRVLKDLGLTNIRIACGRTLEVATPELLDDLEDPGFELGLMRDHGPDAARLRPHAFEALKGSGMQDGALADVRAFCGEVGGQLLGNYLARMKLDKGWGDWAPEKRQKCALGMHGLALTHGFAHSIPKASLPLLWGSGPVNWHGRNVTWKPLFANS